MIKSFMDFVHKYKINNKATSNIKNFQNIFFIRLENVYMNLGDGPFSSDVGIINLYPSKGTHWVIYL